MIACWVSHPNHLEPKNILDTAKKDGLKEGKIENAKETACKLKKLGTFTNQEIADLVGLPLSEIEQLDC